MGNGSDELISYLVKIFDGEEVIVSPPTFEMYEFYSKLHNLNVKKNSFGWKLWNKQFRSKKINEKKQG